MNKKSNTKKAQLNHFNNIKSVFVANSYIAYIEITDMSQACLPVEWYMLYDLYDSFNLVCFTTSTLLILNGFKYNAVVKFSFRPQVGTVSLSEDMCFSQKNILSYIQSQLASEVASQPS